MLAVSSSTEAVWYYSVNFCMCKLSGMAAKIGAISNHIIKSSLNTLMVD